MGITSIGKSYVFNDVVSSIEQICKSKRWWKSDKIMVFLQSHLQTLHEELIINLADTLGKVRFSNETCYFLPQEWSQNTEKFQKDIVIPCFILAGHKAGFALACHQRQDGRSRASREPSDSVAKARSQFYQKQEDRHKCNSIQNLAV